MFVKIKLILSVNDKPRNSYHTITQETYAWIMYCTDVQCMI